MTDSSPADDAEPADAFALVGNETRAAILRVLGEDPWSGLSFSELRSRAAPDMDSGQFNYHLQQLVGQFVRQTEDGYEMRPSGATLYRTIQAGTFNRRATVEPFPAGFDCYFCGATAEASYDDGMFDLSCSGCGHVYTRTMAPPSAVEGVDPDDLLARIDQYNRHTMLAFARGVCPICVNGVDRRFRRGEAVWTEGSERFDCFVNHVCGHCGNEHYMAVGLALLYRPELVCFFHGRGLDVTSVPHWELPFLMTDQDVTVLSEDPWEVALETTYDGDRLELLVDEDLTLVEHRVVEDV
ncbi:winged helix-turn-helix domain-containing protein [Haloglomus litoreum]|uniref:winged helix-turn-helix domain-containing protein n=1 Tax=Haloglomus litoreum TaxID=3034026 RepID=UPI0023E88C48|nr:helix-turn-helix domain-containing protein [Haloglomus sp. DT116]